MAATSLFARLYIPLSPRLESIDVVVHDVEEDLNGG